MECACDTLTQEVGSIDNSSLSITDLSSMSKRRYHGLL